jgi:uncharacterized protein
MPIFDKTPQTRVRRMPERGSYDTATIYPIVDEALFCHVGFIDDGMPFVIPTIHARMGDEIILHGAKASRMLKRMASGEPICVTVTLLDGLVIARSTFDSSMNYRSAVLFGRGRLIEDAAEKLRALEALSEHLIRGRWVNSRQPHAKELDATAVVVMTIDNASAKIRTGPPHDEADDYALPLWAGVIPIQQNYLPPINDPELGAGIAAPDYVRHYRR